MAVVNFGVVAYLARELSKEDFGLLAISSVLLSFVSTAGVGGIGEYIIYYHGADKEERHRAAFWLNMVLSVVVAIVVSCLGFYWAQYYGDPRIQVLLFFLVINYFFESLTTIPRAILRKEIDYGFIVLITTVSGTFVALGKIVCAYFGFGVYSLVFPEALISPLVSIVLLRRLQFSPWGGLFLHHWQEIFKFSRGIVGSRLVSRIANDGDSLAGGKLLGLQALGVYNLAFQVSNVFTSNLLPIIMDVSYPVLAKSSSQPEKLRVGFLKMILLISCVSIPLLTLLIIFAKPLTAFWYGPRWSDAVLPLQILTIFTISRSISSPSSSLFNITNRNDLAFKISVFNTVLIAAGVFVGSSLGGLLGLCIGVTISRVVGGQIQVWLAVRQIDLLYLDLLRHLLPFILVSLLTAMCLVVLGQLVEVYDLPLFILFGLLGFIIYAFFLRLLFPSVVIEIVDIAASIYPQIVRQAKKLLFIS